MADVVLVFPPVTKPSEPPVGIATLAGSLRASGVSCELVDARMEFLESALDRSFLQPFWQLDTYQQPQRHQGAVARLHEGLRRLAPAADRLSATDHRPARRPLFSRADIRASVDESQLFDRPMAALAERVIASRPRLVGISIGYLGQLVAGLQLWRHLRGRAADLPVVIGGSLVQSWLPHLAREGLLGDECYAFGPGPAALQTALGQLGLEVALGPAPPRYAELLQRHRYLAPEPVGSVSLSRGCYWRRCTFCHEAHGARYQPLRRCELDEVVAGIHQQGIELLHLTDHAVAPAALRRLSKQLTAGTTRWYGFVRVTAELGTPSFAADLARSGCTMLELGLESGSPRVLEAMGKGHEPALASRAIRVLHDAGIRVFGYLMFGFPGETDEDRRRTLAFAEQHAPWLHGLNVSIFNLPVGSELERRPEAFGIERLMPFRPGQELSFYRDFVAGHDRRAIRRFLAERLRRSEALAPVLLRTPRSFKSNHAPFVPPHA